MRNGNYAGTVTSMHIFDYSYRTYEEWKHFLPINHYNQVKCSYRTYEEWKRVEDWVSQEDVDGSYRTYEEWKLERIRIPEILNASSYRTYEEWKQLNNLCDFIRLTVLTVPMRNGNPVLR